LGTVTWPPGGVMVVVVVGGCGSVCDETWAERKADTNGKGGPYCE